MSMLVKRIFITIFPIIALMTFGCDNVIGPAGEDLTLIDLQIVTESDTLLLLAEDTKTLKVRGIYVKTEENTVINKGVLTDTTFTYFTVDTVTKNENVSKLRWHSSHENVVGVSNGKVKTFSGGVAAITASSNSVVSNSIYIKVSMGAPELIVDPPLMQLVFQDSAEVSGWVITGINLSLTINGDTISYSSDGRFSESVSLELGNNTFEITATNDDNGLSTTKTQRIIYFTMDEANITGHWKGETLTRPFSFEIYELLGQYIMDGTLTVDLTILGGPLFVQDIVIYGLINSDGTIDAGLSKAYEGFIVTGTLKGVFYSSGSAGGNWKISIEKEDWPTISHKEAWTAEKQ